MNRLANPLFLIPIALALLVLSAAVFTVNEREKAIKLFLGEITESDYQPGLHFKVPLLERVYKFDKRILTLDVQPERVLTNEKKNVIVDSFVKWRVDDARAFYTRLGGVEQRAGSRLTQFVREGVKDAFGQRTVREVISSARGDLMDEIALAVDRQAETLGIEIVDVRIKKVELAEEVRESVYRRMEKDREKIAREIRSEGRESAKKIRAAADRIREETLATAYAEAEQTRGDGDAESARIYAEAYTRDPQFYNLYRSLSAYRQAFSSGNDVMLLNPETEFFRFFRGSGGAQAALDQSGGNQGGSNQMGAAQDAQGPSNGGQGASNPSGSNGAEGSSSQSNSNGGQGASDQTGSGNGEGAAEPADSNSGQGGSDPSDSNAAQNQQPSGQARDEQPAGDNGEPSIRSGDVADDGTR